jgi:hypothetical protein
MFVSDRPLTHLWVMTALGHILYCYFHFRISACSTSASEGPARDLVYQKYSQLPPNPVAHTCCAFMGCWAYPKLHATVHQRDLCMYAPRKLNCWREKSHISLNNWLGRSRGYRPSVIIRNNSLAETSSIFMFANLWRLHVAPTHTIFLNNPPMTASLVMTDGKRYLQAFKSITADWI